nr:MAG TPA: ENDOGLUCANASE DOCKING DOMAIN, CELLULASE [Caudoviricetes sp.]
MISSCQMIFEVSLDVSQAVCSSTGSGFPCCSA